jgi:hypothetical protein
MYPPAGQIAPSKLYVTKQFKKHDVVDGIVSGNSITIQVNDAKQTTGQPYSGTVNLTTTIWDNIDGTTTYWLEALDANGNISAKKSMLQVQKMSSYSHKEAATWALGFSALLVFLKWADII